jgi:hypothetical protein
MALQIHPSHRLIFDPTTVEGQAICRLFQEIKDEVESGDSWPGADLTAVVGHWLSELGFDVDKPFTTGALCHGSGESIRIEWTTDHGGFEGPCAHCGRVMPLDDLEEFPDHESLPDHEAAE